MYAKDEGRRSKRPQASTACFVLNKSIVAAVPYLMES